MLRRSAFVKVALAVALLLGPAIIRPSVADAAPATPTFGPAIDALAAYDGQTTCDPTAKPGAIALRDLLEATYPSTYSLGIGRECSIGGQSEHKEGRAYDWAVNAAVPTDLAIAQDFINWLLASDRYGNPYAMARRLGIMYMIWNRQIWKAYAPQLGWQPYAGSSPHTDHIHFSLSRDGGNALTSFYPTLGAVTQGYWMVARDGGIFPFGTAVGYGSTGGMRLNQPIVGMAARPQSDGYWLVAGDGGIFPFGAAPGRGSTGGMRLNQPIVGMASTPAGDGYWLVASDGGIFPFGAAAGYGSTGGMRLNQPIVGMAPTPSGRGYWLVARDGGIFPFGDASGLGSTGGISLNQPIVGMAATADARGYWLVAADGGIFPFGAAPGYGSTGGRVLAAPIVQIVRLSRGDGYWLMGSNGAAYPFGAATPRGGLVGNALNAPVVGASASRQL